MAAQEAARKKAADVTSRLRKVVLVGVMLGVLVTAVILRVQGSREDARMREEVRVRDSINAAQQAQP